MSNEKTDNFLGKKIFFLYPSKLIQQEIIFELVQQEYEVYIIKNHENFKRNLQKFPEAILFINIDEGMPQEEWDNWIRQVTQDSESSKPGVGVLSASHNADLQRKYAASNKIEYGYIPVYKMDVLKTIKQIYVILQAAEARGRRKYVRAVTDNETMTTINIPFNGQYLNGVIKDISVVGFSCAFQMDPGLSKNSLCKDMQIKLQSVLLKGEGIVFGTREDKSEKIYVFLFTQRIDPDVRIRIRTYVQSALQAKMDHILK